MEYGEPNIDPEFKKKILDVLHITRILSPQFTGQIVINCNSGGVVDVMRSRKKIYEHDRFV